MRAHYWQYVLNTEGQPVSGAVVSLYTGTETISENQVILYTTASGSTTASSITSDNIGFFQFWVADKSEENGQNTNTPFILKISRGTGDIQYLYDIRLYFSPPRMYSKLLNTAWTFVSAGSYEYSIAHNLNTNYPLVQIWKDNKILNNEEVISCVTESLSSICLSASVDYSENTINVIIIGSDG